MAKTLVKYAVTALHTDGLRYLCRLFETEAQANQWVEDVYTFSALDKVKSVLGEDLQVRVVECWPNSGEVKWVVFDE